MDMVMKVRKSACVPVHPPPFECCIDATGPLATRAGRGTTDTPYPHHRHALNLYTQFITSHLRLRRLLQGQ